MTYLNQNATIGELKSKGWHDIEKTIAEVPEKFKLFKSSILKDDTRFDFVLRFKGEDEEDFLDIYFTKQPGELAYNTPSQAGKLKEGYVVIDDNAWNVFKIYYGRSSIARWVRENCELFIVSNQDTSTLIGFLESLAGDKIKLPS